MFTEKNIENIEQTLKANRLSHVPSNVIKFGRYNGFIGAGPIAYYVIGTDLYFQGFDLSRGSFLIHRGTTRRYDFLSYKCLGMAIKNSRFPEEKYIDAISYLFGVE